MARAAQKMRFVWLLTLGNENTGRQELISCTDQFVHLGEDTYSSSLSSDPFALDPSQIRNRNGAPLNIN